MHGRMIFCNKTKEGPLSELTLLIRRQTANFTALKNSAAQKTSPLDLKSMVCAEHLFNGGTKEISDMDEATFVYCNLPVREGLLASKTSCLVGVEPAERQGQMGTMSSILVK